MFEFREQYHLARFIDTVIVARAGLEDNFDGYFLAARVCRDLDLSSSGARIASQETH